jgi:hypothetical protein
VRRSGILAAILILAQLPHPTRAALSPCTLYTAPSGLASNPGTLGAPTTPQQAERDTVPGSVVCFLPGTYDLVANSWPAGLEINRSGSLGAPIIYERQPGAASPALLHYDPANPYGAVIDLIPGAHDITISGLTIDGNNTASYGIFSNGAPGDPGTPNERMTFTANRIIDNVVSGIQTTATDYVRADHNQIWHTGYLAQPGCVSGSCDGSGISLNQSPWSDQAPGFHSFVTDNLISGTIDESGLNTDGNGIILDLADLGTSTPAVLVAGNLVYGNGGRCLEALHNSQAWFVGNTCAANLLDTRLPALPAPCSILLSGTADAVAVDNVVAAWSGQGAPYCVFDGAGRAITLPTPHDPVLRADAWWGGRVNVVPNADATNPTHLRNVNPGWVAPLLFDPVAVGQYANAPDPARIGDAYALGPASALIGAGIDPRALTTDPAIQAGLGTTGALNGRWDLGAAPYPLPLVRLVTAAGLKPTPRHGGRNVCTARAGDRGQPESSSGPWTRVAIQTGACAGGAGWLLGAALVTL